MNSEYGITNSEWKRHAPYSSFAIRHSFFSQASGSAGGGTNFGAVASS